MDNTSGIIKCLHGVGSVLARTKQYKESLQYLKEAQELAANNNNNKPKSNSPYAKNTTSEENVEIIISNNIVKTEVCVYACTCCNNITLYRS